MPLHDKPNSAPGQEQNPTLSGEQTTRPPGAEQPDPPTAPVALPGGFPPAQIMDTEIGEDERQPQADPMATQDTAEGGQILTPWVSEQDLMKQRLEQQSLRMAISDPSVLGSYSEVLKYNTYVHSPDPSRMVKHYVQIHPLGYEPPPEGVHQEPGIWATLLGNKPGTYKEYDRIGGLPVRKVYTDNPAMMEPHTMRAEPIETYYPVYEGMTDTDAVNAAMQLGVDAHRDTSRGTLAGLVGFAESATLGAPSLIPGWKEMREAAASQLQPWQREHAAGAGHAAAIMPSMKLFSLALKPVNALIGKGLQTAVGRTVESKMGSLWDEAFNIIDVAKESSKRFSVTGYIGKKWGAQAANKVTPATARALESAFEKARAVGAQAQGMAGDTLLYGIPPNNPQVLAELMRAGTAYRTELGAAATGPLFRFVATSAHIAGGAAGAGALEGARTAISAGTELGLTKAERLARLRETPGRIAEGAAAGAAFMTGMTLLSPLVRGMGLKLPGTALETASGAASAARGGAPARFLTPGTPKPTGTPGAVWKAPSTDIDPFRPQGPARATPGAAHYRATVIAPPTPGAEGAAKVVARQIEANVQNSTNQELAAQVDHTLRGITRTQYDAATRGAQAFELQDMVTLTAVQNEIKMNGEVAIKRMEALRDLAHANLPAASAAAGTDLRTMLFQPGLDPATGMIESYLWDLARWAEPLGVQLSKLGDPDASKAILAGLPDLASPMDMVGMKQRLTQLASELAKADPSLAVGPPEGVTFDGPIPSDLIGKSPATVTAKPDLEIAGTPGIADAPAAEDWISKPDAALAKTQTILDHAVSSHPSVPLGMISLNAKVLPPHEAVGAADLGDGRVGSPVYLENGRVLVMRPNPKGGGLVPVDITTGVDAALFPADADPQVVNGELSPVNWTIGENGKFLIGEDTQANRDGRDVWTQQVADLKAGGPGVGATPDQLLETATEHTFDTPGPYEEMLKQVALQEETLPQPTLQAAARYLPKELAYDEVGPTQPTLDRLSDMSRDYLRQRLSLETTRSIAEKRLHEMEPIRAMANSPLAAYIGGEIGPFNPGRQVIQEEVTDLYDPAATPLRPLQTYFTSGLVVEIQNNSQGKWTKDQLTNYFYKKQGISNHELDHLNFDDAFAGRKQISRNDLLDWLFENTTQVEVHVFTDEHGVRRAHSGWQRKGDSYTTQSVLPPSESGMLLSPKIEGQALVPTQVTVARNEAGGWDATWDEGGGPVVAANGANAEAAMMAVEKVMRNRHTEFSTWVHPLTGGTQYEEVLLRSPLAKRALDRSTADLAVVDAKLDALKKRKGELRDLVQDALPENEALAKQIHDKALGGVLQDVAVNAEPLQFMKYLAGGHMDSEASLPAFQELQEMLKGEPLYAEWKNTEAQITAATAEKDTIREARQSQAFTPRHWGLQDTVSHFRMDRHTQGDKTIDVVQEFQSDLTQHMLSRHKERVLTMAVRHSLAAGYRSVHDKDINWRDMEEQIRVVAADWELKILDAEGKALKPLTDVPADWEATRGEDRLDVTPILENINAYRSNGVPDSPLLGVNHWLPLTMKAAIKRAAERGATHFAWANGQINYTRYNRVRLSSLDITLRENGTYDVEFAGTVDAKATDIREGAHTAKNARELADVLGVGLTDTVLKKMGDKPTVGETHSMDEEELGAAVFMTAGWTKQLYDEIAPRVVKKLIKKQKWDTQLEELNLDYSKELRKYVAGEDETARAEEFVAEAFDEEAAFEKADEIEMEIFMNEHTLEPRWPGELSPDPVMKAEAVAGREAFELDHGKWAPEDGDPADWEIVDDADTSVSEIRDMTQDGAREAMNEFAREATNDNASERVQDMALEHEEFQREFRAEWEAEQEAQEAVPGEGVIIDPMNMIEITPKMRRELLDEPMTVLETVMYPTRSNEPPRTAAENRQLLSELGWDSPATWQNGVGRVGKATPRATSEGLLNMRGQVAGDPETQATIARPLRNKNVETLHYLYVGEGSSEIHGHMSYSSRLPGASALFDFSKEGQRLINEALEKGADPASVLRVEQNEFVRKADEMARRVERIEKKTGEKVVIDMMHNHPSGEVKISRGDRFATEVMAAALKDAGVKLRHHVVINHDKYSVLTIGEKGVTESDNIDLPAAKGTIDPLATPEKDHFLLGHSVKTFGDVAAVSGIINTHQDEFFTLVYADSKLKVTGLELVPKTMLQTPAMAEWMRGRKKDYGSPNVFMHHPKPDASMTTDAMRLMQMGELKDLIDDAGVSLREGNGPRTLADKHRENQKITMAAVRVKESDDFETRAKALEYADKGGSFSKAPELFKALTDEEKAAAMMSRLSTGYISNTKQLDRLNPANWGANLETPPQYFGDWKPQPDELATMQKVWNTREAAVKLEIQTIDRLKTLGKEDRLTADELDSFQPKTLDKILKNDPSLFNRFARQFWSDQTDILGQMSEMQGLEFTRAEAAFGDLESAFINEITKEGGEYLQSPTERLQEGADQLEKAAVWKNVEEGMFQWFRPFTAIGYRKQVQHPKEWKEALESGLLDRDIFTGLDKGLRATSDATEASSNEFQDLLGALQANPEMGREIAKLIYRAQDQGVPAEKLDQNWTLPLGKLPGAKKVTINLGEAVTKSRKWFKSQLDQIEPAVLNSLWDKVARAERQLGPVDTEIARLLNETAQAHPEITDIKELRDAVEDPEFKRMLSLEKGLRSAIAEHEAEVEAVKDGKYRRGNYISHLYNLLRPDVTKMLEKDADPYMTEVSNESPETRFQFLSPRETDRTPIEDWLHVFKLYSRASARKIHLEPALFRAFDLSRAPSYDVAQQDYVDMLLKKLRGDGAPGKREAERRMKLSFLQDAVLKGKAKDLTPEERVGAVMGDPTKAFSRRMTAALYGFTLRPAWVSALNLLESRAILGEIGHHLPDLLTPWRGPWWYASSAARGLADTTREAMSNLKNTAFKTGTWQSEARRNHVLDYAHENTTMLSKLTEGQHAFGTQLTQKMTELYFRASSLQFTENWLRASTFYALQKQGKAWGLSEDDASYYSSVRTRHVIPSFGPMDASPKLDTNLGRQAMMLQRYATGQIGEAGAHVGNLIRRPGGRPSGGTSNLVPQGTDRQQGRRSTGDPERDAAWDRVNQEPAPHGARYGVGQMAKMRSVSWIVAMSMALGLSYPMAQMVSEVFNGPNQNAWEKLWPYGIRELGGVLQGALVDASEAGQYLAGNLVSAYDDDPQGQAAGKAAVKRILGFGVAVGVPGAAVPMAIIQRYQRDQKREGNQGNYTRKGRGRSRSRRRR